MSTDKQTELIEAAQVITEIYTHDDTDDDFREAIDRLRRAWRVLEGVCPHCGV